MKLQPEHKMNQYSCFRKFGYNTKKRTKNYKYMIFLNKMPLPDMLCISGGLT